MMQFRCSYHLNLFKTTVVLLWLKLDFEMIFNCKITTNYTFINAIVISLWLVDLHIQVCGLSNLSFSFHVYFG